MDKIIEGGVDDTSQRDYDEGLSDSDTLVDDEGSPLTGANFFLGNQIDGLDGSQGLSLDAVPLAKGQQIDPESQIEEVPENRQIPPVQERQSALSARWTFGAFAGVALIIGALSTTS